MIVTEFVAPPIPDRSRDWRATWEDRDTYIGYLCGEGATEESAVIDLIDKSIGHGEYDDWITDLAFAGWKASNPEGGKA